VTAPPSATPLDAWLLALPKAEMHLHLEGAFRWSTIRELHPDGRHLPATPPWLDSETPFPDFADFRGVFRDYVRPVTARPEMIERNVFEVIEDLARLNVRYAELIVSHDLYARRALTAETIWAALAAGRDRACARYPIDARLVLGINRHNLPVQGLAVFDAVASFAVARGWMHGVDLQGDERLGDHRQYLELFRRAAGARLRLRAHAGELTGPTNVRAAVFDSGVRHISHGVRAVEDPALLKELAASGAYLHVCPTSNVRIGCVPNLANHPLRGLIDAGIRCTVNSDDPLLFGTTVLNEYRTLVCEMGFSRAEVAGLAKNGLDASLLPPERISALSVEIDTAVRQGAIA